MDTRRSTPARMNLLTPISAAGILVLSALTLAGGVGPQCISRNDDTSPPPRPDLGHITPFSVTLFKEVLPSTGNFVFSPYSVWSALVLAYFGSGGNTQAQLEQVLQLTNKADTLALYRAVTDLHEAQDSKPNYTLNAANKLFVQEYYPILECVRHVLGNKLQTVNFRRSQKAAAIINQYVRDTTRGKISQLVRPREISRAHIVIANAVYFKGLWEQQFLPDNTRLEKFYPAPDQHAFVDMMTQENRFPIGYSGDLDAQVLEIPYRERGASMFVFLPRDRNTGRELDDMLRQFQPASLRPAIGNLVKRNVLLKFPKFRLENSLRSELTGALIRVGIEDLFSTDANMQGFFPTGGLKVKDGVHSVMVEFTEEGAEINPIQKRVFGHLSYPSRRVPFVANRPFLFLILDNYTNSILFFGVFRKP
ncbi:leukocyte elastase inhibitor-like [Penaeus japonicus]|uniref:leukocyte elastase inhibitor-like n=1 Tax=Penaeus japonicus TaxID=27405 RepID=UPI001C70CDF1|nr:leukocyte elastase inhibitor-like [Penaeus japonicus]